MSKSDTTTHKTSPRITTSSINTLCPNEHTGKHRFIYAEGAPGMMLFCENCGATVRAYP